MLFNILPGMPGFNINSWYFILQIYQRYKLQIKFYMQPARITNIVSASSKSQARSFSL